MYEDKTQDVVKVVVEPTKDFVKKDLVKMPTIKHQTTIQNSRRKSVIDKVIFNKNKEEELKLSVLEEGFPKDCRSFEEVKRRLNMIKARRPDIDQTFK